jgi:PLP dependent protein
MSIAENIARIKADVKAAARPVTVPVTLIAVSKQQPVERIQAALDCGQRAFGENRVQEAADHWAHRRALYPGLQLHLIGPLQTNKVTDAVALFDVIHTVDRPKLVDVLAAEMRAQKRFLPCFIQVNTGAEPQKAGVLPQDLDALLAHARAAGLNVVGLMCIPPVDAPAGVHFAFLKTLADPCGLAQLSMGMSDDYKEAVLAGATHVRIGSALFGER